MLRRRGNYERTPVSQPAEFHEWSDRFRQRADQFEPQQDRIDFRFFAPTIIALMADLHVGSPNTDYKRIEKEADKIVHTANMYVIFAGDLIDNMHWNPGQMEQEEQPPEQLAYMRALLEYLARDDKLLHSIDGDHDGWLRKMGYSLNDELARLGVSSSRGPTYFNLNVKEQNYQMAGAHQLPGHSIYNVTHPQMRAVRFGSMHGADVVFSGHNHKKGVAMAYQHELGQPQQTNYIALGPYKSTDGWLQKKGWATQKPLEMGGVAVRFDDRRKEITIYENIVEAQ